MQPPLDRKSTFVHCHTRRGHLIATVLTPNMGQREVPIIAAEVGEAIALLGDDAKGRCFVLDLSQVSLISSLGLGTCVDLRNTAEKAGLRPVAFGLNRHLVDLFRLMRIDRLYEMPKNQQELDALLSR